MCLSYIIRPVAKKNISWNNLCKYKSSRKTILKFLKANEMAELQKDWTQMFNNMSDRYVDCPTLSFNGWKYVVLDKYVLTNF